MNTHLIPRFRANAQIRSAANTAVTLLYPRRCPFCDEPVKPWNALVCAECRQKFSYIEMPYCLNVASISATVAGNTVVTAPRIRIFMTADALSSLTGVFPRLSHVLNTGADGSMPLIMPPA